MSHHPYPTLCDVFLHQLLHSINNEVQVFTTSGTIMEGYLRQVDLETNISLTDVLEYRFSSPRPHVAYIRRITLPKTSVACFNPGPLYDCHVSGHHRIHADWAPPQNNFRR